ncbi:MAG TPA: hypothetical protein VI997_05365 [Candidatus Thermoplasmatota archaeon]|nr:hypothetical protein [Candidatus Thermoplasmatota archaeon]
MPREGANRYEPRVLRVGEIRVRGSSVEFRPAPEDSLEAEPGEVVDMEIAFDYEEGSPHREECRVALRMELDGRDLEASQVRITDRPLVRDRARGRFVRPARLAWRGDHPGRFTLEVTSIERPWTGIGPRRSRTYRQDGKFTVRVR